MEKSARSKYVLITGCSSGFGKLMVKGFLTAGWNVLATTRKPQLLHDMKCDRLLVLSVDVSSKLERDQIVEAVTEKCTNGLDCLVNNAGYSLAGPLEALEDEQIRKEFEVNFFAPVFLTRDLLLALREASGKVINISSILGRVGMPMQSLYVASKFALEGLSESLSYELAEHGVKVVLVEPGGYATEFAQNTDWPEPRSIDSLPLYRQQIDGYKRLLMSSPRVAKRSGPDDVAALVVRLASQPTVPLRVRSGADAEALHLLRRFLPQRLGDELLKRITHRLLYAQ